MHGVFKIHGTETMNSDEIDQGSAWKITVWKITVQLGVPVHFRQHKSPGKDTEEIDAQCLGALWRFLPVTKRRTSWKLKKKEGSMLRLTRYFCLWGLPFPFLANAIMSHFTIFNRPDFNEAIMALFVILGWEMAIEEDHFTARAVCLLSVLF